MDNLEKKESKKKRTYPKDFDQNNELYTLSCKKEKILLTGDPEEDMKKIQTINSEDKKNRLNIMDKKDYSLISFITSTKRPDLYHRYCFTSGEDYTIKLLKNQNEKVENSKNENEENEYSDSNNSSSENYSTMKNKSIRYFTFNTNITYKCFNCGEVGHMSGNCPYENIIYCLKCNKKGHEERDCTYTKCFKCNQFGHKSFQCPFKIDKLKICTRCFGIGHKNEDCLKNPIYPSNNYFNFNKCKCSFCGSNKHLVCPFSNDKLNNFKQDDNYKEFNQFDVEKWEENRKKIGKDDNKDNKDDNNSEEEGEIINDRNYFEDLDDSKIASCIFCPICAGRHTIQNCEEYKLNQDKYKNKFDEQRENFVKNLLNKNRDIRDNHNRNRDYNYNNNNREYNNNRDYNNNNKTNNKEFKRERSREKDFNNFRNKDYNGNKDINKRNKDFDIFRNKDFNNRNKDFSRNENNYNDNNGRNYFESKSNNNIKGFGRGYHHEKKFRNNSKNFSKKSYFN